MNKVIYMIIGFVYLSTLYACKDIDNYLDKSPTGGLPESQVFSNFKQIDQFLANIYSQIPDEWYPGGSNNSILTYSTVSDEASTSVQQTNGPSGIVGGLLSPTFNPLDRWATLYASIRVANLFLEKTAQFSPKSQAEITGMERMKGEVHFLRAWFYMELFKRYGGVPKIDRVLQITDDLNIPRNTAAEIVSFIVSDCEIAALALPVKHSPVNEGRVTKGAALMLKTKALVYAASLLHNPENNSEKWSNAAAAAQDVMDLKAYTVDNDYKELFHKRNSPNLIFQSTNNQTLWVSNNFPMSLGGISRVQPLQNMVDAYEMKATGKDIFEAGSGYQANAPYEGRDPRFYHSIIYDGALLKGNVINTYLGSGTDAIQPAGEVLPTQTGYYLAKTVDDNGNLVPNSITGNHYWIFMRYEETLLLYAEAQNEALSAPDQSVYDAINAVRTRPGIDMPPIPIGLTKVQMRERIRHERRIELAFEGQRFWDIKRWRIGEQTMKEARGMLIEKVNNVKTYKPFIITNRVYKPAFDLFPIPEGQIEKQGALVQNPGYN